LSELEVLKYMPSFPYWMHTKASFATFLELCHELRGVTLLVTAHCLH